MPLPNRAAQQAYSTMSLSISHVAAALAEETRALLSLRATLLNGLLSGDVETAESYKGLIPKAV